ncbi:uncharacterized protein LOC107620259 [Arachis ipaensis]|uniref:uncharacterized protein LOC107620259 n=1 Tax=Arachis ipaensis TaxID=130454 RepID=UPI0007AF2453|nr:uncharacterized protein LOC107620259 [Arachis ipaensis]XP_025684789.1 uncharacterized protein LOC112785542 [Arachis hypogaea]
MELIEMVANNQYLYSFERTIVKKGVTVLDTLDVILTQNKAMCQQINAITQRLSGMQVSAFNAQDTSYDMSDGFPQGFSAQQAPSQPQNTLNLASIVAELSKNTYSFMQKTRASLRNLEIQVGQLSKQVLERSSNTLPSDTFMKDLLSKKKTLRGDETVVLTKKCNAIIQSKLPKKMPDPRSFQIPCTIGSTIFDKALCDLGASINLMLLSVMKKLQIQEVQPTRIALQMADKSLKHAHGMVENVLVKVGEFFFPVDFVILEMGEDENVSIILGRPFLATGRALIDVEKGEFVLRVHEELLIFKVFGSMQHSSERNNWMKKDSTNPNLKGSMNEVK